MAPQLRWAIFNLYRTTGIPVVPSVKSFYRYNHSKIQYDQIRLKYDLFLQDIAEGLSLNYKIIVLKWLVPCKSWHEILMVEIWGKYITKLSQNYLIGKNFAVPVRELFTGTTVKQFYRFLPVFTSTNCPPYPQCYAAKFDPTLSLDCAPTLQHGAIEERKVTNFAIWQPWWQDGLQAVGDYPPRHEGKVQTVVADAEFHILIGWVRGEIYLRS